MATSNAIADYSIGIELDPKDTKAYVDRGFSWEHKGNYDKAILDFNKAIALDPKDRYAYEGRAFAWSKIGRSDKAEEDRVSSSKLRNGR